MILDKQGMFSDDQDLAQTAGTYSSTNLIDLAGGNSDVSQFDIGRGNPVPLLIQVTETFASAGAATCQIVIEADNDINFGSATQLWDSGALAKATLVEGYRALVDVIPRQNERYLRVKYVIGTATTTAGKITAGFVVDRQDNNFGG